MRQIEITDELLYKHAPEAESLIFGKLEQEDFNHIFSEKFNKRINKLIKREKRIVTIKKMTGKLASIFLL